MRRTLGSAKRAVGIQRGRCAGRKPIMGVAVVETAGGTAHVKCRLRGSRETYQPPRDTATPVRLNVRLATSRAALSVVAAAPTLAKTDAVTRFTRNSSAQRGLAAAVGRTLAGAAAPLKPPVAVI